MNEVARSRRSSKQQIEQLRALAGRLKPAVTPFFSAPVLAVGRWLLVIGVPAYTFGFILLNSDQLRNYDDFGQHATFARTWLQTGSLTTPHFLNTVLVVGVEELFPR